MKVMNFVWKLHTVSSPDRLFNEEHLLLLQNICVGCWLLFCTCLGLINMLNHLSCFCIVDSVRWVSNKNNFSYCIFTICTVLIKRSVKCGRLKAQTIGHLTQRLFGTLIWDQQPFDWSSLDEVTFGTKATLLLWTINVEETKRQTTYFSIHDRNKVVEYFFRCLLFPPVK